MILRYFIVAIAATMPSLLCAQAETTTYTYDAIGRVVDVESDQASETVTTEFQYDDANNRTLMRVTETVASAPTPNSEGIEQVASAAAQPE